MLLTWIIVILSLSPISLLISTGYPIYIGKMLSFVLSIGEALFEVNRSCGISFGISERTYSLNNFSSQMGRSRGEIGALPWVLYSGLISTQGSDSSSESIIFSSEYGV